jgi:hypothetical protein
MIYREFDMMSQDTPVREIADSITIRMDHDTAIDVLRLIGEAIYQSRRNNQQSVVICVGGTLRTSP